MERSLTPPSEALWPWLILHREHVAWYQRALLLGDFRPGCRPRAEYVRLPDGTLPDPAEIPRCATCGEEPRVEDLLGGSAVKYEPDAVIMMLPRWHEGRRDVGFVVAKNRAGPTDVEVVHPLVGRHFCFAPRATAVQPYSRGSEQ